MMNEMKELMKECDELMKICIRAWTDEDAIMCLDETSLAAMQGMIRLYKKSKDLSLMMAEKIDEQDKKLDKIIKLLGAKR